MDSGRFPIPMITFVIVLFGLLPLSVSAQSEILLAPPTAAVDSTQDQQAVPAELTREIQDMHDFMKDEAERSSLGIVLIEAEGEVDKSGDVQGLKVLDVLPGTPAAKAGLKKRQTGIHTVLAGAVFVAALAFPPAMFAAALVQSTQLGESYDLIIGVDSQRVRNFEDFSDRMSRARRGELVYLDISRSGKRLQIPVEVP